MHRVSIERSDEDPQEILSVTIHLDEDPQSRSAEGSKENQAALGVEGIRPLGVEVGTNAGKKKRPAYVAGPPEVDYDDIAF